MPRHAQSAVQPAEAEKRAAVAAAALEDLDGGAPTSATPPPAAEGAPVETFDAEAYAGNLRDTIRGALLLGALVVARRGQGELAKKLLGSAEHIAGDLGFKLATLLRGRAAGPLTWTGLIGGALPSLLTGAVMASIAHPPKPSGEKGQNPPAPEPGPYIDRAHA